MTTELTVLLVLTGLSLMLVALTFARRRWMGRSAPRRGLVQLIVVLVDVWLFQAAFAHSFGPQHWLIAPLTVLNLLFALGVIYSGTGLRMRADVGSMGGGTIGMMLGRDASMQVDGFGDDLRR